MTRPDPNALSTLISQKLPSVRKKKLSARNLDSSLKIYVLKFQIGVIDTFGVIRISVKAVFSIFSDVFHEYLPI